MRKSLINLWEAKEKYNFPYINRPKYVKEGHCEWCGKKITNKRRRSFCSDDCSFHFNQLVTWQRKRNAYSTRIIWRDNITCQNCGTLLAFKNKHGIYIPVDSGAEVHHIKPVSLGGDDNPDNLITLCHICHLEAHKTLELKGNKNEKSK